MKNIVIPAILAATVLVAGMFAYIPIEKASTIHGTILTKAASVNEGDTVSNAAGKVNIVADSDKIKRGHICIKTVDGGDPSDADLELAIEDDLGRVIDILDSVAMEKDNGECVLFTGFRVQLDQGNTGDTVSFVAQWTEEQ